MMSESDPRFRVGPEHMAPHLLIGRAAEFPDEWAIENVETGQASTYRELLDSVARWARVLAEQGVRTGDFVLSMLADQGDGIRSWLASAFVGAVEVPINPQHRGELLRAIVAKVAPRVVLVDQAVFQDIDAQDLCGADTIVVPGLEEPNHRSRRT